MYNIDFESVLCDYKTVFLAVDTNQRLLEGTAPLSLENSQY